MRPYSKDLKLRVLAAVDSGTPREEAAGTFSVSVSTIKRWLKRRRQTGGSLPALPPILDAHGSSVSNKMTLDAF